MIQLAQTDKVYDVAIIGGGILGLWAARHAIQRGERVVLIEKRHLGAGASGGFLGALMPHMPDNWNVKKQFQYEGLSSIGDAIAELEADTGVDCGFRRCGRIMPLMHERLQPQVERRLGGALQHWGTEYEMTHFRFPGEGTGDASPDLGPDLGYLEGWLNADVASLGVQQDTLSGRVNPRAYLRALETYVRPRSEIQEGLEVVSLNPSNNCGSIELSNNQMISAGRIVVANGWEAYPLLQTFLGHLNDGKPIGRGVKGQAVLVEFAHDDTLPIVYHDGTYVVPHAGNRVAIGSTSLNEWTGQPDAFDPEDLGFYNNAIELVPALRDAPIVDRWAGVRPRNTLDGRGTSPWLGPVPGCEGLVALMGGFKITLGVAHLESENPNMY